MIEPKNGEWWLCERGGVKTVFLRKEDEWRSDERDTYSYCDVVPLFKMIEDKPSDCAAVSPKHTRTEYEKVTESIFDLRDEFERGELSFQDSEGDWVSVANESELVYFFDKDEIYRKVEKVVDERQEFVDLAISKIDHTNSDDPGYYADWFEQLYDSGCRFQD